METEYIAHYLEPDKRPQSVVVHLQEAAELASLFAGKVGLPSLGKLEGLVHDLGKYSNEFQRYIRSAEGMLDPDAEPVDAAALKGKIDHSTAGAQVVWETLKDRDQLSKFMAQAVALCVASHHSGLMDCICPDGEDKFSMRMAKQRQGTHVDEARKAADGEVMDEVVQLLDAPLGVQEMKGQLEGLFQGEESRDVREFYVGLLVRFLFSCLIDADRLSSAGRASTGGTHAQNGVEWDVLIGRLEGYVSGLEQTTWVDKIRAEVSLACRDFASREKGLYQLTVPTGGGKTLSSLRFGLHHAARHRMDRLIYVIPYTSIIDQNARVARSVLEQAAGTVVLEHHSNLAAERDTWLSGLLAENWDAQVIFTTSVQFLETLFARGTRAVRRMHNLANAVIGFDEIQTLPVKTIHLFNNAANFLVRQCGSTVVFCTATQPLLHAVDPKKGAAKLSHEPEMAPRPKELFRDLRRVEVLDKRKTGGWTDSEIADLICDQAKAAGSALAVVNTKAAARALFELCKQQLPTVFHLSANMCPTHRLKIIDDIKVKLNGADSAPMVCVSTQLIEAGVDVDFSSVVRYMAGLDSIAQVAGRCNRNGRRPLGKVLVVNPAHESLSRLPEIQVGKATAERVLDEYRADPGAFDGDLLSPKAVQRYYQYYFFDRAHEMAYHVSAKKIGHDDDLLSLLSTNPQSVSAYVHSTKSPPPLVLRQSFKTAGANFEVIDAPTEGIIVPYGEEGNRMINELCAAATSDEVGQLLRQAQRYSVNVYPQDLARLATMGCLHETQRDSGVSYLDARYYSDDLGVVFDPKQPMSFLEA
ncbi:MAG: CRISPR-associated endonuclease Cas3'' [Chloroflexi bacterium]|nr:CRISPR-associated endonuclease Cas3'' [Chloroflexota bacterium]